MSKHTPGPWVLKHVSGSNFAVQRFEIRSGSGMPHPIFNKDTSAIDGSTVCMSPHDANLIAAAPDLLEALEKCVTRFEANLDDEENMGRGSMTYLLGVCSDAIARARGQS